uniref:Uncharacterized protein n=1 Tax=Trichuris muris TaxID=70415 RepID=A0A5S6QYL6_TRIMR
MDSQSSTGTQEVKMAKVESNDCGETLLMYSDVSVRMAFIRKVFLLLMLQLCVTSAFIAMCTFSDGVKDYVQRKPGIIYVAIGLYLISIFTMMCVQAARRQVPCNYICMGFVTLSLSFLTGVIAAQHTTQVVLLAALTCCMCCFVVAVFATQAKCDMTPFGSALTVAAFALVIFGFISVIAVKFWEIKKVYMIYAGLACFLIMGFFAFDIQLIMGNKQHCCSFPASDGTLLRVGKLIGILLQKVRLS